MAATTAFYADQVWEGHYDMIANGYIDQYFSACNQTSIGTTLYFYVKSERPAQDAFMADLRKYAEAQLHEADGVEVSFHEGSDENQNFLRTLMEDTKFASGAVLFVFLLILLQTRSLIITGCGFVHIVLSLPVGQFFYGVVLGIDWISFLQALPLFIIMGIGRSSSQLPLSPAQFCQLLLSYRALWLQFVGSSFGARKYRLYYGRLAVPPVSDCSLAPPLLSLLSLLLSAGADDVFVFLDAWRRSTVDHPEFRESDKLEERLIHVMQHSVKAMSITSVTTAAAFSAICLSPVAPLRTLGIFSALVVMSNFVLCVTWFPAIVVVCYQHGLYKDAQPGDLYKGMDSSLVGTETPDGRPIEQLFAA